MKIKWIRINPDQTLQESFDYCVKRNAESMDGQVISETGDNCLLITDAKFYILPLTEHCHAVVVAYTDPIISKS